MWTWLKLMTCASGLEEGGWVSYCIALSAGSFCYVALLEVLPAELEKRVPSQQLQVTALGLGFALMAVVALWV